jgi:hypothetical protein
MKLRLSGLTWAVAFVTVVLVAGVSAPTPARADVSIYDIQTGVYPELAIVQIDSVVVTGAGMFGYFVQEPIPRALPVGRKYSGIWVYTGTDHTKHKGDIVSVRGQYQEYYLSSELSVPDAGILGSQILMSHVSSIPEPVSVKISEVNDTGVDAEAYEGVFIKVDRDDPTLSSLREYEGLSNKRYWTITTGAGPTPDSLSVYHENSKPGDDFSYGAPDAGTPFTHLQGILQYTRDRYRLGPRSCEEDFGAPCKPRLAGGYATGSTTINVQFDTNVEEATAQLATNYELASFADVYTAQRDPVFLNTVHLTTDLLTAGASEQIIVHGVKSTGLVTMDGYQTADFRAGITPIYQIQFVPSPAVLDSSSLGRKVVTVEGRVTAVEGNYYYLQEGNGGQWKGLYCRVAQSGLPRLRVGDRVQASGEVTEYFGMTELVYKVGIDNFKNLGKDPSPVVVNIVTTADLHYRDPAGPNYKSDERWESCLVKLLNATFRDSIPGTAGPYFDEWLLASTPATPDTAMLDMTGMTLAGGSYDACPGNRANLTGVLHYAYDKYRIYPRSGLGNDIIELHHMPGCPTTDVDPVTQAAALDLRQNRPNPFGLETSIGFALPTASLVRLEVIDVSGRLVKVLAAGPLGSGEHVYQWDGTTDAGRHAAAGTYFYQLRCDGRETSRRMVLLP